MSKVAKHRSEVKYAMSSKRWLGHGPGQVRRASKAYNKAVRRAVKLSLSNY